MRGLNSGAASLTEGWIRGFELRQAALNATKTSVVGPFDILKQKRQNRPVLRESFVCVEEGMCLSLDLLSREFRTLQSELQGTTPGLVVM